MINCRFVINLELQELEDTGKMDFGELSRKVEALTKELDYYKQTNAELNTTINLFCDEQREIQKELRRLKKSIETLDLGVTITSLDGIIEYINPALAKMHGYTVDELMGKHAIMLAKPNSRKQVSMVDLDNIETWRRERENITKEEKVFPVQLISTPIKDPAGNPTGIITITEDISDRKKDEKVLKDSEEILREQNVTKDKFFSILAHDLRSIFNTLIGSSELLVNNSDNLSYSEIEEFQQYIYQTAKTGFNLLQNLLDWSRLQRGVLQPAPVKLHVFHLTDDIVHVFNNTALAKEISLVNEVDEKVHIYADKQMISTVLRNLISNAIKFTHRGGYVYIKTEIVDTLTLKISVVDTGVGIEPEKLDNLFKAEENESTTGTEQEKGTGLGLMLCKEFVEINGGRVQVSTELGVGSIFSFTAPLSK